MAANTLPSGIGDLFLLAERIEAGLTTYGPWLLRGSIPAEEFSDLLKAARDAEAAFSAARSRKAAAGRRFAAEEEALTSWLAKPRLVVMLAYGSKWSESWIATGFTHRGTNVPKRIAPRIELSRKLADFFTEHGEYEVAFAGVTAADAHARQEKIATAEREVRLANAEATAKKRVRDAAEKRFTAQNAKRGHPALDRAGEKRSALARFRVEPAALGRAAEPTRRAIWRSDRSGGNDRVRRA